MNLSFELGVDVRCTSCGAERVIEGKAERVLEPGGAVLYADLREACDDCGGHRVRLEVKIDDGCEEEHPRSGPPESGHR